MQLTVSVVDSASLPLGRGRVDAAAVALPFRSATPDPAGATDGPATVLLPPGWSLSEPLAAEVAAFLSEVAERGSPGTVHALPRPTRDPARVLLVGTGDGQSRAWRDVGAALVRATADRVASLAVALPDDSAAADLALGAWLAAYRYRAAGPRTGGRSAADQGDKSSPPGSPESRLRRITLVVRPGAVEAATAAVSRSRALADAVALARDLTNTPSAQKSPKWFADRIAAATARRPGLTLRVLDEVGLADAGFGGVLAVGSGSPRPPRLVELTWRPRGARTHVVLVGKGICFDSGGISIKPVDAMKLMRKDMGAAAAVCAATLAAADLGLPVRVTALAPVAENMVSGSSMRPGDVIRHFSGITTEVLDTDAEGRLVLGDALAYAAKKLKPDYLIDLATLTGASHVALGKQIAALFSDSATLAEALYAAGEDAGEPVWRLPLPDDYLGLLRSEVADLANVAPAPQAGAVVAAMFLRELAGDRRDRWAHIDMSAPSWTDRDHGPLVKGATGWGVRLLVHFLRALPSGRAPSS